MDMAVHPTMIESVELHLDEPMGDHLLSYDPHDPDHERAFIALLQQQGEAHGLNISEDTARASTNRIGSHHGFDVTFISGDLNGAHDVIKGMTVTTEADFVGGNFLYLEDLVVSKAARQKGSGLLLLNHAIITAWEMGKDGFAWEVGRNNVPAQATYKKVDPQFDLSNLHDVWRISERKIVEIARDASIADDGARLAMINDLDHISRTLEDRPRPLIKLSHLASALHRQGNGIDANSFVVMSKDGSFTIASVATSTFKGNGRGDVRIHLNADVEPKHVSALIKETGRQMGNRRWRGPVYIEFGGSVAGMTPYAMRAERQKVALAQEELARIGGDALTHDNAPMVSYHLDGKRFVDAVALSAKNMRANGVEVPLSPLRAQALDEAVSRSQLAYT